MPATEGGGSYRKPKPKAPKKRPSPTSISAPKLTGTARAITRGRGKKIGLRKQAAAEAYMDKKARQFRKSTKKIAAKTGKSRAQVFRKRVGMSSGRALPKRGRY